MADAVRFALFTNMDDFSAQSFGPNGFSRFLHGGHDSVKLTVRVRDPGPRPPSRAALQRYRTPDCRVGRHNKSLKLRRTKRHDTCCKIEMESTAIALLCELKVWELSRFGLHHAARGKTVTPSA